MGKANFQAGPVNSTASIQAGRHWGNFSTVAAMPNGSGFLLLGRLFAVLKIGDTAFLTTTNTNYVCVSVGAVGAGDAVWQPTSSAGAGVAGLLGPVRLPNIPLGAVAYGSVGTDVAGVSGTIYGSEGYNPASRLVTTISILNGAVVGTNNYLVILANATGVVLGTSALAGALSAGADSLQAFNLLTPVTLPEGRYYVAVQYAAGATATFVAISTLTYLNATFSQAGVFGTVPATLTIATTFTANIGPIHVLS